MRRRTARHFADVRLAVEEMARVSGDRVLLVDTTFMGDDAEEAETLRDPSHVRNYSETEWRLFLEEAALDVVDVRRLDHAFDFAAWLARTGCEGEEAALVEALLGGRVADGRLTLDKVALRATKRS